MEAAASGAVVSFHHINFTVQEKLKRCCGKLTPKQILKDVSGVFRPGMNAILGPTGSGKTTLLDILAGRKDPQGLEGDLLVDGAPQPDNFKCVSGYVVQNDILMGTLTVRENLRFSAALRLPSKVSDAEKEERVDQVIDELGLNNCANTRVGTDFTRGISGGERKRTSIGIELITSPAVLFLDEPTTGLDACTAAAVIRLLNRLSKKGRTVIFSIHQPRYAIYRQFDTLHLMAAGKTMYHGPSAEVLDYFSTIGYMCEEHNNPADFFLDVISGEAVKVGQISTLHKESETDGPAAISYHINQEKQGFLGNGITKEVTADPEVSGSDIADRINEDFLQTPWAARLTEDLKTASGGIKSANGGLHPQIQGLSKANYATSFPRQLFVVSKRALKNLYSSPHVFASQITTAIFLSLVISAIYWQVDNSLRSGIQNRIGALFFIITNMVFSIMGSVEVFIKERPLFIHEVSSGFYRVSVYFLAKVFCDLIPMRLIPTVVLSTLTYWMIGFRADAGCFFFYMATLFLTTLTATSVGLMMSATVSIYSIASVITAMIFASMMIFSGLLVNLHSLGKWLFWIKYLSIYKYAMEGLSINELKGMVFCDEGLTGSNATLLCKSGEEYLDQQGISHDDAWSVAQNILALLLMASFFLTIAYIQLRRIKILK